MDRHVLDNAEDWHLDLLEHLETLPCVEQRDVLRRRNDDGARDRDLLRQRQLGVTGTRRQVDHQVVEFVPVGVVEQLLQRLSHHRSAPNHRRFFVDQKADRHRLQVVAHHRFKRVAVLGLRLAGDAEHAWL